MGGIAVAIIASSDHLTDPELIAVVALLVGWGFIGVGLLAWGSRPDNRIGPLMAATGFAFLLSTAGASDLPLVFTLGQLFGSLFLATAVHMLLAAPSGRLQTPGDRRLVWLAYLIAVVLIVPLLLVADPRDDFGCTECPENLLLVTNNDTALTVIGLVINASAVVLVVGVLVSLVRRWRRAAAPERRLWAGVYAAGVVLMGALVIGFALTSAVGVDKDSTALDVVWGLAMLPLAAVPYLFLFSFVRARMIQRGAMGELIARIRDAPRPGELRDAIAEALGDPTVELAYWLPEDRRWVDGKGRMVRLPAEGSGRAATRVERDGQCVAAIVYDSARGAQAREHVDAVGAAAALGIQNERLDAELRAKVQELRDSRRRMLSVGLEERRRLERDLHDGAQQRLVSMALNLRLARARLRTDPDGADGLLVGAGEELDAALEELRELARGIHPALLTDRGLDTALETLVHRAPLPVELRGAPGERLPEAVELAAYFVVSEALTNVVKYAAASHAVVDVMRENGRLVVEVTDDGVGGADPERGTGLRGLADRLAVLEGRLEVHSERDHGTTVRARIPCE